MKNIKIIASLLSLAIATNTIAQQQGRSIGRGYSKKLLDQEKHFDELKKSNGEAYGNKELSLEIAINKNVGVCIENTNRAVEIKVWDEPKVKITTTVYIDGATSKLNSDVWFEKLNVKTRLLGNSFKIIADAVNIGSYSGGSKSSSSSETVEVYSVDGQYIKSEPAKRKVLTIFVPRENGLCLKSKYADAAVVDAVKKLDADITNGNLELNNVGKLSLTSKYANVYANEIENAEIDFINGDLNIVSLGNGELETKYSKIEIGNLKKMTFSSTNDDYEIEEADVVDGNKSYGNMKIDKLNESIQIDGTNADVRIKKINADVKSIWFDDKYANLKLSLKEVKNFSLEFEGVYSNIYKNFFIYANEESKISLSDTKNSTYKAIVGNGAAKINIKCPNCTVDFK